MTKLEQVARANYAEMAKPEHGFWFSGLEWEDIRGMRAAFLAGARASVEAMRDPTKKMITAMSNEAAGPSVRAFKKYEWNNGIDCALAEAPAK